MGTQDVKENRNYSLFLSQLPNLWGGGTFSGHTMGLIFLSAGEKLIFLTFPTEGSLFLINIPARETAEFLGICVRYPMGLLLLL